MSETKFNDFVKASVPHCLQANMTRWDIAMLKFSGMSILCYHCRLCGLHHSQIAADRRFGVRPPLCVPVGLSHRPSQPVFQPILLQRNGRRNRDRRQEISAGTVFVPYSSRQWPTSWMISSGGAELPTATRTRGPTSATISSSVTQ